MTLSPVRILAVACAAVLAASMLAACSTGPDTSPTEQAATPQEAPTGPAASASVPALRWVPPEEIAVGERIYDKDMSHGILVVGYVPSVDSPGFTEMLDGSSVFLVHLRIDAGDRYREAVASVQFTLGCDHPAIQKLPLDTEEVRAEITAGGLVPLPQFGVEAGEHADVWLAFTIGEDDPAGCNLTYARGERTIIYGGSGTIESFTQTVPLN